jgi:hypothetical protein
LVVSVKVGKFNSRETINTGILEGVAYTILAV